jgi:hypothetical protein
MFHVNIGGETRLPATKWAHLEPLAWVASCLMFFWGGVVQ